jgi:hypothetical protein
MHSISSFQNVFFQGKNKYMYIVLGLKNVDDDDGGDERKLNVIAQTLCLHQ